MKYCFLFSISILIFACNSSNPKVGKPSAVGIDTNKTINKELESLNIAIQGNASNPDLYNKRANYFLNSGNLEKAYADLQYVFTLDSVTDVYYNTLAQYHILKAEPALAEMALKKSIQLNPKSASNRFKLGELYYLGKKYKLSFQYLNEGLRIDKYDAKAYYIKGLNFKEMGKLEESNSNFQTAIEQNPEYYEAYLELALYNFRVDQNLSKQYYQSALRIKPNSIDALYGLAFIYQSDSEWDKSIKYYQEILNLEKKNLDALYNLSVVYYSKPSIDSSLLYVNQLLELNPRKAEALALKGLCYISRGDKLAGKKLLKEALAISPNLEMAKRGLFD